MAEPQMRDFIVGILRDMEGNALLSLAGGRSEPSEAAPHGKLRVDRHHWFSYPAELDAMVAFAEKAYSDRVDAYLSPIIYGDQPFTNRDGKVVLRDRDGRPMFSRSKENALFAQTVYMDSDRCPPSAFRLPPSRHVTTSEGHGHDYWFLPEPVPAFIAASIAHKITTAHKDDGCDPTGWSANKVLRLPTFNTTYDELSPFEVVWEDDDVDLQTGETDKPLIYSLDTLEEVYGDVEVDATHESGALVQYAPVPDLDGLPPFEEIIQRIPATERRLNDLIYKTPKGGPDGWRSEQRYALLLDLKRFGLTDEETVSVAWHSPAASKWREDKRGVDGLWWELQVRVKTVLALERGDGISAAEPIREHKVHEGPKLLTAAQRSRVEGRSDLITLYLNYARAKVQVPNMPYHIINAWTLLSLGLSEAIELPKEPRALGTGIYSISLGLSSSGKDESKAIMSACARELYPHDDPDVPASSSREALIENLIERDGKVTYLQSNEADGLLGQIKQGGYSTGIVQYWTLAYDGEVPSLGRVGRKELNKPNGHAIVTMHLMGTPRGMLEILDKEMFYSGYLARQIWVLGDDYATTEESLKTKFRRGEKNRDFDAVPKYLGAHFSMLRARLRATAPLSSKRASIEPTDEAIAMLDGAKWKIHNHLQGEQDADLWKPVLRRFGDILWKIAALSAASHGRTVLGTRDVEVALYYGEKWIANAMTIADRVSDSFFSRQCDEIEKFIAGREGQAAELGAIYRFRKNEPKRVTDEYLQSLTFQGRIEEAQASNAGPRKYRIKRARMKQ